MEAAHGAARGHTADSAREARGHERGDGAVNLNREWNPPANPINPPGSRVPSAPASACSLPRRDSPLWPDTVF